MSEPVIIGNATRSTAIYAFCEWPSLEPRYVGKTTGYLIDRRKAHLRTARSPKPRLPVHRWLKKRMDGCGFATVLIEHVRPGEDWAARERYWIAEYRRRGHSLLNLTDGGEGLSGHIFSADHRAKISAALKTGSEFACETCGALFWRKRKDIIKGNCRFCSRSCYAKSLKGVSRLVPSECTERGVAAAAAKRRAMTHCKRGHALSGDNLFLTSAGSRACKECRKIHKRTYRSKARG